MDEQYQGPYIEREEVLIKDKNWRRKLYTKEEQSRICEEARELYLESDIQYEEILTQLAEFGRKPHKVILDGDCLFRAVMCQLKTSPQWTPMMFRKMTAYFMVKHWDIIAPLVVPFLDEKDNFESYVRNIFLGKTYGDAGVLATIGFMYNIKITVISPGKPPLKIYHTDEENNEIILIHNGREDLEGHYSGTSKTNI